MTKLGGGLRKEWGEKRQESSWKPSKSPLRRKQSEVSDVAKKI